jgi:hypothetical protein
LDSLVAPIALYPDPLLSQVLVSSTYPLELVQLQMWLEKAGKYMNEKAIAEAVQKENWDPSIQAMAALPTVVRQLVENIKWTTDLGNAFLAQQTDVMEAVQRMRVKAKDAGKLKSNDQIKVETAQAGNTSYVMIEQASPEVVYVPDLRSVMGLGSVGLPISVLVRRLLRWRRDLVRLPHCDRRSVGWRLGLGRRMGSQQRQYQRQQ